MLDKLLGACHRPLMNCPLTNRPLMNGPLMNGPLMNGPLAMSARVFLVFVCFGVGPAQLTVANDEDFPAPINTQPGSETLLTAQDALTKIHVPDGFRVSLFAGEPDVQQPISLTTDARGRLWIAENYTYAESSTNFDLRQRDRIIILEDSDHDGVMDKRTVFWDQGRKLTSVEVGFGGVWALCPPQLLFLPDRDGDDRPDGPPEVVLDGWNEDSVRHNIANGLKWGPDGWLYGRHGILATSQVGQPGAGPSQRTKVNCGIWRYHPTRAVFEVVAYGTTNSWGFDYDQYGEMFFINTVIGHLWHVVPGAHYRRMYGVDFNPHLYQLIEQTADHFHWDTREQWNDIRKGVSDTTSQAGGGHAHSGLMIYQGDNWPSEYRGNVLTVNYHGRRLNRDQLARRGAGYVASHSQDMLFSDDIWFRGIDLISGADGGVYIADWSDIGECHDNDGVHRSSGRIFKVTYGKPHEPLSLQNRSPAELVSLLQHDNDWYARQVRRSIQEQHARGEDTSALHAELTRRMSSSDHTVHRLRAMWCLNAIHEDGQWLLPLLQDREEAVRSWAIRLLLDRPESPQVIQLLKELAARESSPLVLLHLASALQKIPLHDRWAIATVLAGHVELHEDLAFPLLLWYGIEPAVAADHRGSVDKGQSLKFYESCRIPQLRQFVARRLASDWEANSAIMGQLVKKLPEWNDELRQDSLRGILAGLVGLRKVSPPSGWQSLAERLGARSSDETRKLIRELAVVFGDGRALAELRSTVSDAKADSQSRHQALRALIQARDEQCLPLMFKLITDRVMTTEIVRGLAAFEHADTAATVLGQYGGLDPDGKSAAIDTLTSRVVYAQALVQAIKEGRIKRNELTAYHARQIAALGNETLTNSLVEVWGDIRNSDEGRRELIAQVKSQTTAAKLTQADPRAGRALFQKSCANCHVLYGQGKLVGPDLTGSNRRNVDYLLENILDPSAVVAADFRAMIFSLLDGRVVTGVIIEQNETVLRVQTATEPVVIARQDIESTKPTNQSLMPDGLLKDLMESDRLNLFAYLMSTEPPPP